MNYLYFIFAFLLLSFGCKDKEVVKNSNTNHNSPPNIIFLLTDDQRWDALGYAGNTTLKTPQMDSLASNGVYFKNAYVTTSICAVSRASILTGQYARRHEIWGFDKDFTQEQLNNTYPLLLKKAGYAIGFIGKYGVGSTLPEDKFDFWEGFSGQGTFYQMDENGNPIHLTQKISKQATEFLKQQAEKNSPFCLSISFKVPHVEGDPGYFNPDAKYHKLYVDTEVAVPHTSSPDFYQHFPNEFTENNVARNRWKTRFSTPEMQQESIKNYYRLIHGVDVVVGNTLDQLKETGKDNNTVIVFTSDNGFYLGEYGFAGKWYGSEPSIRVPMIYDPRPGAVRGKTIENKVLNIDIAPTLLSIEGIPPPSSMQGADLTSLIENTEIEWRDSFFYEHLWQSSDQYYIPSTEGIVSGSKKYMKYFMNRDTTDVIFEEFYDLEQDPLETVNLIGQPEVAEWETVLKDTYAALKKSVR